MVCYIGLLNDYLTATRILGPPPLRVANGLPARRHHELCRLRSFSSAEATSLEAQMKAFVTGPTGFLGINLLQQLAKEGWDIVAFHRPTSDLAEVKKIAGVEYAVGDVRDLDSVLRGLPIGVDAIFHTAGSVGFLLPEEEKSQYEINELGTRNLVTAALVRTARRFIYTSTVLTYDFSGGQRITEQSPPNTNQHYPYIHSKYLAEREVET